jgi:hypothetical protein
LPEPHPKLVPNLGNRSADHPLGDNPQGEAPVRGVFIAEVFAAAILHRPDHLVDHDRIMGWLRPVIDMSRAKLAKRQGEIVSAPEVGDDLLEHLGELLALLGHVLGKHPTDLRRPGEEPLVEAGGKSGEGPSRIRRGRAGLRGPLKSVGEVEIGAEPGRRA